MMIVHSGQYLLPVIVLVNKNMLYVVKFCLNTLQVRALPDVIIFSFKPSMIFMGKLAISRTSLLLVYRGSENMT